MWLQVTEREAGIIEDALDEYLDKAGKDPRFSGGPINVSNEQYGVDDIRALGKHMQDLRHERKDEKARHHGR